MTSSRPSDYALTSEGPFRLYSTMELCKLEPPKWLVKDILPEGGFIGLYGDSYAGKSYLAIDMAMSVASGHPWHGHVVEPGFVIYIAAEGGHGIRKRAQAWCKLNGINPNVPQIGWMLQSVPIHPSSEEMDIMLSRLEDEIPARPVLVVIDTLARCFPIAGNENQQEDMGQFVAGVDRLRTEYDAAVIAVHHTRVDNDRERGSTAFRGAADTMILVRKSNENELTMKCTKQKDFDEFEPIILDFQKVEGATPELNSAALMMNGGGRLDQAIRGIFVEGEQVARRDIYDRLRVSGTRLVMKTLQRHLNDLVQNGELSRKNGIYWKNEGHVQ